MAHKHQEETGPELAGLPSVELTLADHIPSGGEVVMALWEILPQLPGQVISMAGDLPEILHIPDFELGG